MGNSNEMEKRRIKSSNKTWLTHLIVSQASRIGGELLDHIYQRNDLVNSKLILLFIHLFRPWCSLVFVFADTMSA